MHAAPTAQLQQGLLFARRYRIVRCIKAGGMGAVYEAVDERTQRHLALKAMHPSLVADADLRARFEREAKITSHIRSEHIVQAIDAEVDVETGTAYIAMDLLEGEELGAMIARRGPLAAPSVVLLLRQAARALEKTHRAGIVHRDLKPENLFVTYRDDGSECLKILDFGIAKVVEGSNRFSAIAMIGTPLYMAPEQMRGHATVGPSTDLYALAHIAFAMLVGSPYRQSDSVSPKGSFEMMLRAAVITDPASERAASRGVTLPRAFDPWFAKAAAFEPRARFGSASEMVEALAEALGLPAESRGDGSAAGLDTGALPPMRLSEPVSLPPMQPIWKVPAVLAAVVLLLGIAVLAMRSAAP